MKATDDPNIFNTRGGIFVRIINNTLGIVVSGYILYVSPGNKFFILFGLAMVYGLTSSVRTAIRTLHIDRSGMSIHNKINPFLTLPGIIISTISATGGICMFLPILSGNIEKGDASMIALNIFNLAVFAFCLYSCMRSVHRFVRKNVLAHY